MHVYSLVEMFGRIKRWVLVGGGMLLGMGSFEVSKAFSSLNVCLPLRLLPLDKDVAQLLLQHHCVSVCHYDPHHEDKIVNPLKL